MAHVVRRGYARSGSARKSFLVGRIDRKTAEMVLPKQPTAPFPGPWTLHAVVGRPEFTTPRRSAKVIPFPGVGTE